MVRWKMKKIGLGLLFLLIFGGGFFWQYAQQDERFLKYSKKDFVGGLGDVHTLQTKYERWKTQYRSHWKDQRLVLPLRHSKGLSTELTKASGHFSLNFLTGATSISVDGLSESSDYGVWLVDNRPGPGQSVKPDSGDAMISLGTLSFSEGASSLDTSLEQDILTNFRLDLVVVTQNGKTPMEERLLVGSPTLFQRMYYNEQRGERVAGIPHEGIPAGESSPSIWTAPFRLLVPPPAYAKKEGGPPGLPTPGDLETLVGQGEHLFFNETFNGNGRTCGTCHAAENNTTIDPDFIANLPPGDPLFVHDVNSPAHIQGLETLENDLLLREVGLVLENVDGFGDDDGGFANGPMRGTPHTLALGPGPLDPVSGLTPSLTPDANVANGNFTHPLGWSGDGSANDGVSSFGSLRDFATGAVTQHFTTCLPRLFDGTCFRLPTPEELDAMEAFQLSLGRPSDVDLASIQLTSLIPRRGRAIFLCTENNDPLTCNGSTFGDAEVGVVPSGRCHVCHFNAGASNNPTISIKGVTSQINGNFDTGVEDLSGAPGLVLDSSIPCDGGFGRTPEFGDCGPDGDKTGFGDRTFNTAPLIEAADTAPFFHNNAVQTLVGAVTFYNGGAFNNSQGAVDIGINGFQNAIGLDEPDAEAVAAFLSVLNALENIRNSLSIHGRTLGYLDNNPPVNPTHIDRLIMVSRAEVEDAIQVLTALGLHMDAVAELDQALQLLSEALDTGSSTQKESNVGQAMNLEQSARGMMCTAGAVLCVDPPGV